MLSLSSSFVVLYRAVCAVSNKMVHTVQNGENQTDRSQEYGWKNKQAHLSQNLSQKEDSQAFCAPHTSEHRTCKAQSEEGHGCTQVC